MLFCRPEHSHDHDACREEANQHHGHGHHHHHHGHDHSHSHPRGPPTALPPPINDNQDQQTALKVQIRQIQANTSLTPKEKAESVQNLMMKKWNDSRDKVVLKRQESDSETERKKTTYFVRTTHDCRPCVYEYSTDLCYGVNYNTERG